MGDWWFFWDRQEWYWSALSFFTIFFILFVMFCLCWKFFHPGHDDDDCYDRGHVIMPCDPAPSLIILHAQTPPSENERILRRCDGDRAKSYGQLQFHHYSPGGCGAAASLPGQYVPYHCAERQASTDHRPPPYAPNY